jgi:hypothetical protein
VPFVQARLHKWESIRQKTIGQIGRANSHRSILHFGQFNMVGQISSQRFLCGRPHKIESRDSNFPAKKSSKSCHFFKSYWFMASTQLVRPRSAAQWTYMERRTVWWVISLARETLGVPLDPVVANAFVILQHYFRGDCANDYELFYLIAAALLTSCKAANSFRPVSQILRVLSGVCKINNSQIIKQMFLIDDDYEFTMGDVLRVDGAEIELLKAINFDYQIETPFPYFTRWKEEILGDSPDPATLRAFNQAAVDICLIICSAYYLDVPPEVAAAAAASEIFGAAPWISSVQEKYGSAVFDLAMQSIRLEKSRTQFSPAQRLRAS